MSTENIKYISKEEAHNRVGSYDKIYSIDTNIILDDAHSIFTISQQGKNLIILTEVVLDEVDSKKSGLDEINFQAREFARCLIDSKIENIARLQEGTLVFIKVNDIDILLVSKNEYNLKDVDIKIVNDRKIILANKWVKELFNLENMLAISNDLNFRTRCLSLNLPCDMLNAGNKQDEKISFYRELPLDSVHFNSLENKDITEYDSEYKPNYFCYKFISEDGNSAYAYIVNKRINIITDKLFDKMEAKPLNVHQKFVVAGMLDTRVDINVVNAKSGSGKAQPLSEKVLTDTGWRVMGDIKVGDNVIGSNGLPTKVLGVFPQGERDIYSVKFIDGTEVKCDLDHIWSVRSRSKNQYNNYSNMTVREMLQGWISKESYDKRYDTYQKSYNYSIPRVAPCHFDNEEQLPIHPYAMGLLLGDGGFTGSNNTVRFTNGSKEICERLKSLLEPEYTLSNLKFRNGAWVSDITRGTANISLAKLLENYDLNNKLSIEKHIPKEYLYSSLENRMELWQGLTDTDGHVKKGKVLEFSTSSKQLSEDYLELSRSLGKVFTISSRIPKYTYLGEIKEGNTSYRLRQMKDKPKSIVSIEYSHREEAKCIAIEAEDSLYVTNGFNLTHNTLLSLSSALRLVEKGHYQKIYYIRNSIESTDKGEDIGYLSGNEEKFKIYNHPLMDSLEFIARQSIKKKGIVTKEEVDEKVQAIISKHGIETVWVGEVRGRSFTSVPCIAIIDEVQNMSNKSLQTVMTRFGKGSKLFIIGSQNQIDNLYINKYSNGLNTLLKALKEEPKEDVVLFGGELHKVVRGTIAEWAENLFSK